MSFIREFFQLNHDIVIFTYGQVFFVMGLAVALHSRRYSRLDLARSLTWLAAFGITHGLHEWGDHFIPIQSAYLSPPAVQLLYVAQLVLLAASFSCLLQFGVALLRPLGRTRWLHGVSAGLFVGWLFLIFFVILPFAPDLPTWRNTANALARYFIGFPGGLLAGYGLRQQTYRRIAPLNVPHIVNTLRAAGIALVLYAFLGGLIVPPVSFFPGNVFNSAAFEAALGIPPPVLRSLIGLVLAVTIIRALEVFDVEIERTIESMEQQQILAGERSRIARELHDGAIQKVYTAGLLVESARHLAPPDQTLNDRLGKAVNVLDDAIRDLRQNLSELHAAPANQSLLTALRGLAEDPRVGSLVDVSLDIQLPEAESLSPVRTDHVLAIVQEALSNVVRHSRARSVWISASKIDGRLRLTVRDDGVGMPRQPRDGYGLRNMRDRARLLGGQLAMGGDDRGTTIRLDVPWKEER